MSASFVAKYLKSRQRFIDNETVYNYLSKLESTFILHRCFRFGIKDKEILKNQKAKMVAAAVIFALSF